MTKRADIKDGTDTNVLKSKFGLIYTCNCGWVDLGHLNPTNTRMEIGATNLWKQLTAERPAVLKAKCAGWFTADECKRDPYYRFGDGSLGFLVRYRQDNKLGWFRPGEEGTYIVKQGLDKAQKERVAFAIFREISLAFETFQKDYSLGDRLTQSGFSQEDLVSNLIGFYIGIGKVNRLAILKKCQPVTAQTAYAIWDRDGAVGLNKNKKWRPRFAQDVMIITSRACEVECLNSTKLFPPELESIQAAEEGILYKRLK